MKLEFPARHQTLFHFIFGIQVPQESVNDLSERKREQIQCIPGISFRTLAFQKVEAGGPRVVKVKVARLASGVTTVASMAIERQIAGKSTKRSARATPSDATRRGV